MNIENVSSKFKQLMQKGNENGTLRLLTNNMSNDTLTLSNETWKMLEAKHVKAKTVSSKALLYGRKKSRHSVVFDDNSEELVLKATIKTKSECGSSVLDADWRRILTSHSFGSLSVDLRKSFQILSKVFVLKIYKYLRLGLPAA